MRDAEMSLKVLLPFRVFVEKAGVSRIVAETRGGSYGFLPHRLDCVAALSPGILSYQIGSDPEISIAVDEGVLVKTGTEVIVSVRRAIGGSDLDRLRDAVEQEFLTRNEREQIASAVTKKLETRLLSRFAMFRHE